MSEGIPCLRVGNAVVLAFALQSWIAWFFTCFYAAEEGLKSEFDANSDVLQNLRMDGG